MKSPNHVNTDLKMGISVMRATEIRGHRFAYSDDRMVPLMCRHSLIGAISRLKNR